MQTRAAIATSSSEHYLRLARVSAEDGEGARAVAVLEAGPEGALCAALPESSAADKEADLTLLVQQSSYDDILRSADRGARCELPYSAFLPPLLGTGTHIAAGMNYGAHAAEVGHAGSPVLFPKVTAPTSCRSRLRLGEGELLDYELELGVCFDRDIAGPAELEDCQALFFTAIDVSDRAPQIWHFSESDTRGFPASKSKPGYLPLGPFAVLARDWRRFERERELRLTVNGRTRQSSPTRLMLRPVEQLVLAALEDRSGPWQLLKDRGTRWELDDRKPVPLRPRGGAMIPRGTILLTGTPDGVVLRPPTAAQKARHALAATALRLAGRPPFPELSLKQGIKLRLIEEALASRRYLQPGDTVHAEIPPLGAILLEVT